MGGPLWNCHSLQADRLTGDTASFSLPTDLLPRWRKANIWDWIVTLLQIYLLSTLAPACCQEPAVACATGKL